MDKYIENLRTKSPLIHNITNMVTINDVANIELACGARPIMAMAPQEMEEVTGICDGLNLNIGTPSAERFEAMRIAALTAQKKGIPITLDLVGVGVSRFRMDFVQNLLSGVKIDVIKGNLSEIKAVMEHGHCEGGVEVTDEADKAYIIELAGAVAQKFDCVAVVTGETDYIAEVSDHGGDGTNTSFDENMQVSGSRFVEKYKADSVTGGNPMMKKVTGTGCQLSGLISSFVAANPEDKSGAAKAALQCMKRAGELAADDMFCKEPETERKAGKTASESGYIMGNATYRDRIIDAVYRICCELH